MIHRRRSYRFESLLLEAIQQGLKRCWVRHPDSKRTSRAVQRDRALRAERKFKEVWR